ncbi:MAG: amino acid racemase [Acidobacteria bacterium]|nr:amino acid racemase [Acidobacteriota bacterium]
MRTIGVLGGMGPQATIDFERRLHRSAQALLPIHVNEGYPPVVTVYVRHAPVVVGDNGKPSDPLTLDPRFLEIVRRFGDWADLLVCPSNTPHFFLDEMREASGCEMVSIIDVTVAELRRRDVSRVGLTGLGIPKVYAQRLAEERFEVVTPSAEQVDALDDGILRLMEGRNTAEHTAAGWAAVNAVRDQGVDATILGCTEIPLVLGDGSDAADLINPAQLLADAVIRRAAE